jgi:flagellar P-ring protein precursor FlgI
VNRTNSVSQPNAFGEGRTARVQNTEIDAFEEGSPLSVIEETVTIGDLVRALNSMGTTPTDLISIIQAIKASGALSAEVEMM